MEINISCQKCPSYRNLRCSIKDKTVNVDDEMCEEGYELRLNKGVKLLAELYGEKEKFESVLNQIYGLQKIYAEKFIPDNEREEYLNRLDIARDSYLDVNNKKINNIPEIEKVNWEKVDPKDDIPF